MGFIKRVLAAVGISDDVATAWSLLIGAIGAMSGAAIFGFQWVNNLPQPAQITFITAFSIAAAVVSLRLLQALCRTWDRFYGRYSSSITPKWLRDDTPRLTDEQNEQLALLHGIQQGERTDWSKLVSLSGQTVRFDSLFGDPAYIEVEWQVRPSTVRDVHISRSGSGNIRFGGFEFASPPIVMSSHAASDGVIHLYRREPTTLTLRQMLEPSEVRRIHKRIRAVSRDILLDFSHFNLPVTYKAFAGVGDDWEYNIPVPKGIECPVPETIEHLSIDIDQVESHIEIDETDKQKAIMELVLKINQSGPPIVINRCEVQTMGRKSVVLNNYPTTSEQTEIRATCDFEEIAFSEARLTKASWKSVAIEVHYDDDYQHEFQTQVLFTPTPSGPHIEDEEHEPTPEEHPGK